MKVVCVIPARYASSRFPGKPLALLANHPMIEWVYRRALKARKIDQVMVATDDERIANAVKKFGGNVCMTPSNLASGTDRVAMAVEGMEADVVINLQGDEPLVDPRLLDALAQVFEERPEVKIATPIAKIHDTRELTDPNLVRVAIDHQGFALFFTRSIIPYLRDVADQSRWIEQFPFYKHIGIYAYRKDFLLTLTKIPPGPLEMAEKLEQLRVLENGYRIFTVKTAYQSHSVDTPDDLKRVNALIKKERIGIS